MPKAYIILLLVLRWSEGVGAQQLPLFSQLQSNIEVINPAAISANYLRFEHNVQLLATYHDQWRQFEGHPRTAVLSGSYLADGYEGVTPLLGATLLHDQTGPTGFTGASVKLAGILSPDPYNGGISLGLQAGFNQYRLNVSELKLRDEETIFDDDDRGRIYPDVGVGLFAYKRLRENVYYAGLSSPQLLALTFDYDGRDSAISTRRYRHYYAQLGAIVNLTEDSYLEPSASVKRVPGIPTHVTANLRYQSELAVFTGLGVSSSRAIHGELGVLLGEPDDELIRIGYGFDYTFQGYGQFAGATHEFHLSYSLYR